MNNKEGEKMTVNYFIKCPVCGTITRMRTPAGYIYNTPVRIHCGKCNTLLTGEFISDKENAEAYYIPKNCEEVPLQNYEYYGEASGEILCKKIQLLPDTKENLIKSPRLSPVFSFLYSMSEDNKNNFINYTCFAYDLTKNWDLMQIKYNLFLNGEMDLIKEKYETDAKKLGYNLSSDFEIMRYVYCSFFFDCGGIFKRKEIKQILLEINHHFRHLNIQTLKEYINFLDEKNRILTIQTKLFEMMFSYMKILMNLIPAIGANLYDDSTTIDKETLGLTTCSFEDIKSFYQDAYENLADCCDLVVGLDNIENRGSFNMFTNKFDMDKFSAQSKGNRIKHLGHEEFFAKTFNFLSDSNEMRNAIGHNDYNYKGIQQTIEYTVQTTGEKRTSYLLDVAIESVKLMQSAYILMFFLYEIQRYKQRTDRESIVMNPVLYSKTKNQDRCPCGSGRKYKDCCKSKVAEMNKQLEYPNKSCMNF